jgi:glucose/arabinose dehydrogenase
MNRLLLNSLLATLFLTLGACASTAQQAPQASAPPDTTLRKSPAAGPAAIPAEDVTKYRSVFPTPKVASAATTTPSKSTVVPTNSVNVQVEQRLRDQAYTNQNVKYAQGYRILVYLGLERDKVMAIRRAIIGRYPDETDYITFKSPVYRLYIGDYLTRLDAARGLARLRGLAPKLELEATQVVLNKNP